MYLARIREKHTSRYIIRESFPSGPHWLARDLMDLGADPAVFIVYPGGNAFYVDTEVGERLEAMGAQPNAEEIEALFWPFVDSDIRYRLDHFRTRSENIRRDRERLRNPSPQEGPLPHMFDRRRLHFLRFGRMDQRAIGLAPRKLFRVVENKSRDEIEHYFIGAERILKPHEWKQYIHVIFDLQRFFTERIARTMPQGLDPDRVDEALIREICRLNRDADFWNGMTMAERLNEFLVRYLILHFDSDYPQDRFLESFARAFMDRHRRYRPPRAVEVSIEEASRLFAANRNELRRMERAELARRYRQRAKDFHPDRGGSKSDFIKLTEAYHRILRTKP
ncbi:MAG: J domain-containing protein [Desulfobacterales bacterium]